MESPATLKLLLLLLLLLQAWPRSNQQRGLAWVAFPHWQLMQRSA